MEENVFIKIKKLFLEIFFPEFCLGCKKEGEYLCSDCKELLDILRIHRNHKTKFISDLYFPLPYKSPLVKKLISNYKYEPFLKDLAGVLSFLILNHFQLLDNPPLFISPPTKKW